MNRLAFDGMEWNGMEVNKIQSGALRRRPPTARGPSMAAPAPLHRGMVTSFLRRAPALARVGRAPEAAASSYA